jgi:hypothetical protein
MPPHELGDLAQLRRLEAAAPGQTDRIEPQLGDLLVPLDVDMGRLAAVTRVEEEPVRANSQDRGHGF